MFKDIINSDLFTCYLSNREDFIDMKKTPKKVNKVSSGKMQYKVSNKVPSAKMPKVANKVPSGKMPKVANKVPSVNMPKIPNVQMPKVANKVPSDKMPKVSVQKKVSSGKYNKVQKKVSSGKYNKTPNNFFIRDKKEKSRLINMTNKKMSPKRSPVPKKTIPLVGRKKSIDGFQSDDADSDEEAESEAEGESEEESEDDEDGKKPKKKGAKKASEKPKKVTKLCIGKTCVNEKQLKALIKLSKKKK
jgi:hypothetical protein